MDLPNLCISLSPDSGTGDHTNAVRQCLINGGTIAKLGNDQYYKDGNKNRICHQDISEQTIIHYHYFKIYASFGFRISHINA